MSTETFSDIVGTDLSAVVFMRDYVQLQFDGPLFTAITMPIVIVRGEPLRAGEPGYRDALCEMIGKVVRSGTAVDGDCITLTFEDDSVIAISLKPDDYRTAEAATYRDAGGGLSVW